MVARQRQILAAAAAAGVSVAFGAPLGGVLFSLGLSPSGATFRNALTDGVFPNRGDLDLLSRLDAMASFCLRHRRRRHPPVRLPPRARFLLQKLTSWRRYIDPYNTGKLVLFQVTTTNQVWRGFELIPWLFLGACGGLWGAWFIRMNEEWERLRRASEMRNWRVTEVGILALLTAVVSYLMLLMRIPTSELVANLFQDCSALDPLGLCEYVFPPPPSIPP